MLISPTTTRAFAGGCLSAALAVGGEASASEPSACPRVEDVRVAPDIPTPVEVQVGVGPGATEQQVPDHIRRAMESALDRIAADSQAPAVGAAIIVPDVGRWSATRGAGPRDLFSVGSIGMAVTATLVMDDVEAGRISLEDTLSRWFPHLRGAENTTIDQLLTHHSGYASFNDFPALHGRLPPERPQRLVRFAVRRSASACPTHALAWSNTNYVLLGLILEDEHDHLLHEVILEKVLTPTGLGRSRAMDRAMPPPELLHGHDRDGSRVRSVDYGAPHGSGNLAMTAHDLATLWHALLSGHIASPQQVDLMLAGWTRMQPPTPIGTATPSALSGSGPELYYGRGMMLVRPPGHAPKHEADGWLVGHTGNIRGFSSMVAWSTSQDAVIAVTLNGSAQAESAFWALHDALQTATETP